MQGCQPDVAIFNSMIAACAHGGEHVKARAMFDCMTDHGCQPDAVTYANLIRAFKKVGRDAPVCSRLQELAAGQAPHWVVCQQAAWWMSCGRCRPPLPGASGHACRTAVLHLLH